MPHILPFGPKSARFIRRPPEQDALLNILSGSVRSSKTWTVNAKLIGRLASGWWPGGIGLITGNSKQTVKNNILNDLFATVGSRGYKYNSSSGELILLGRPFLVCHANNEASWKAVAGSTVGIWYGDELALYPKSFFEMAVSRLSLPGSVMWGTTNPGLPAHYLKTEYIDKPDLHASGEVWYETFNFEDNPNISDKKKAQLRRLYTGAFKLRYIDGLWVAAEGSIYRDVFPGDNEKCLYDNATRPVSLHGSYAARYIPVDVGTDHPQCYLDIYDDGEILWVDNEYFWDSRAQNRQKTNGEYAADLAKFIGLNTRSTKVIIPPECASFSLELTKLGIWHQDADNSVSDGIKLVASMFLAGLLRINRDRCPNLIREMPGYIWDPKAAERGVEQPVKLNDDACDALRYGCQTMFNPWRLSLAA